MLIDYLNIDLVQELGLSGLSKEAQEKLLDQINEVLNNRLSVVLLENLSEVDKEELDKVLDSDGSNLEQFLREKIPTFDIVIAETIAELKKELFDMQTSVDRARANIAK